MSEAQVLNLFAAPEREDCLRAVSLALLKVRATGATCKEIARKIDCSADTVENASNERALLGFDSLARLAHHYPETRELIEGLWHMGAAPSPPSWAERLEAAREEIRHAMNAMEREAGERRFGRAGGLA